MIVAVFKIIPKFGPFKPLAFEPLTADLERAFLESFDASCERYGRLLGTLRDGRLSLRDTDLDTGQVPRHGINTLADKTYRRTAREAAAQGCWHDLTCAAPRARRTLRQPTLAHLVDRPEMNGRAVLSQLRRARGDQPGYQQAPYPTR